MKPFLLFFTLLIAAVSLAAQPDLQQLPPEYEAIMHRYSHGRYLVKSQGKYGLCDTLGKIVCPAKYDRISLFRNGYAKVQQGNLYGMISLDKEILPCMYDEVFHPTEDRIVVCLHEKWGCFNGNGSRMIVSPQYKFLSAFQEGMAYAKDASDSALLIDIQGNKISDYPYQMHPDFQEGISRVRSDGEKSYWGYINKQSEAIIPCRYFDATHFSEGIAAVATGTIHTSTHVDSTDRCFARYGYVCTHTHYEDVHWRLINPKGEYLNTIKYDSATAPAQGMLSVKKNGKWGFVNHKGEEVIPCLYDETGQFQEEITFARVADSVWLINKKGKRLHRKPYRMPERQGTHYTFVNGYMSVWNGRGFGFVNLQGKEIIPCEYQNTIPFSEGLFGVAQGGKFGYVDKTNRTILPFIYQKISPFQDRRAEVQLFGRKPHKINPEGEYKTNCPDENHRKH